MLHGDQSPKFTASHPSPPPDLSSYLSPCLAGGRACLLPRKGLSGYEHQLAFPISVSPRLLGQVPSFPLWLAEGSILLCQTFPPSSGAPDSQLRRPPTCSSLRASLKIHAQPFLPAGDSLAMPSKIWRWAGGRRSGRGQGSAPAKAWG